ncbi:MAG: MazG family protein [Acidimicrobiaceae bacterium]|nr:MazG family protein [Acidimicrobiaceae bacterium]
MGRIVVGGLGPGAIPIIDGRIWEIIGEVTEVVFRTDVHPGVAASRSEIAGRNPSVNFTTFDPLYERAGSFETLYREMSDALLALAQTTPGVVLYLVPGSPLVGEKSVDLLRESDQGFVEIIPGVSFLELVWSALGIDPFGSGVTMIDAVDFRSQAKLNKGPYLLTQVWSKQILSEVKLALAEPKGTKATVLQRLGTSSEAISEVAWDDLDKIVEPDHLTTIYIPRIPALPGPALVELYDIIARLRNECPWDREQTHQSLVTHLIEESYEVVDAIESLDTNQDEAQVEKLFEEIKGELGDLLVQVYFHANLAMEDLRFDLSDVAETVTRKLIRRHPHVFTELEVSGSSQVVANWEKIKQTQEGRSSILEGIPQSLPSLLLVSKLLRKATAVGITLPTPETSAGEVSRIWSSISSLVQSGSHDSAKEFGELLWWIANLAKEIGIDLESALRSRTREFIAIIKAAES